MKSLIVSIACGVLVAGMADLASGQAGVSSMSVGAMRAGVLLRPNEIRVEEFINYHRHDIPLPKDGNRVHLDTRWQRLPSGKIAFQIGLASPRDLDPETMRPLNLVLVIDRSGSMSGDRIENVKRALLSFTEQLREQDLVTIVSYSDEARVDVSACRRSSVRKLERAVEGLRARGSTNLHAGLMLGYEQALDHYDARYANRVALLTDGNANRGVSDALAIAKDSKAFNKRGIDLSTIGLGFDFNRELLRELADVGRGAVHFVNDSTDIRKTFVDELDSLLSPAADQVVVTLESQQAEAIAKIYGYSPEEKQTKTKIKMDDMGHGSTQVIIGEMARRDSVAPLKVTVRYRDQISGVTVSHKSVIDFDEQSESEQDFWKNYSIARLAYSLSQSAKLAQEGDYSRARKKLKKARKFAERRFVSGDDPDVDRILKLAKRQLEGLYDRLATGDR